MRTSDKLDYVVGKVPVIVKSPNLDPAPTTRWKAKAEISGLLSR